METAPIRGSDRLLRLPEVVDRVGLSRATIYSMIKRAEFPRPIPLTGRLRRWPEDVVDAWLAERRAETTQ
jgi:prophage regulatory protein